MSFQTNNDQIFFSSGVNVSYFKHIMTHQVLGYKRGLLTCVLGFSMVLKKSGFAAPMLLFERDKPTCFFKILLNGSFE